MQQLGGLAHEVFRMKREELGFFLTELGGASLAAAYHLSSPGSRVTVAVLRHPASDVNTRVLP